MLGTCICTRHANMSSSSSPSARVDVQVLHKGACMQDRIQRAGAADKLVPLLKESTSGEVMHRALLALRIMSDKEADRLAIMRAGGIATLVQVLKAGLYTETAEFAAAVLGNLAAGSQNIKDAIRQVRSLLMRCSATEPRHRAEPQH